MVDIAFFKASNLKKKIYTVNSRNLYQGTKANNFFLYHGTNVEDFRYDRIEFIVIRNLFLIIK